VPCLVGRRAGRVSTSGDGDPAEAGSRAGSAAGGSSFATYFATVFNTATTALSAFA
jgi:hypothetical protein